MSNIYSLYNNFTSDNIINNGLFVYDSKIEKLRAKLFEFADSLPYPLNSTLNEHYRERINYSHGLPMLGEYAVYIAGDLFEIKSDIINNLAFPWLLFYEYSLLLDDLLDKSRPNWKHELVLSQELLEFSLHEYRKILGNNNPLWETYKAYQNEARYAILYELNWSNIRNHNKESKVIIQQGRKSAMLKFCAATLVYLERNRLLTKEEEEGIDLLCAGIQLLDDLTDITEDHKAGRLNFILAETYNWIKFHEYKGSDKFDSLTLTNSQLLYGLIYSKTIIWVYNEIAKQISHSLKLLNNEVSQVAKYFISVCSQCQESSGTIEQLLKDTSEKKKDSYGEKVDDFIIVDINQSKSSETYKIIEQFINNGPKASN